MNRCRNDRRRHGFTLIELLVASFLAAVLVGGLVLAAGALGRDARQFEAQDAASPADAAVALVRRDLANAHSVTFRADHSAVIVGHGGVDPQSLRADGRLVRIEYHLIAPTSAAPRDAARPGLLLVRDQRPLDGPVTDRPWREMVAVGIGAFELSPASSDAQPLDARGEARSGAGPTTVPSRVRLRMATPTADFDRVFHVR